MNYDRLVMPVDLAPPAGWGDNAGFLADLRPALEALHTTQLQWTQQAGKETLRGQAELQMQQLSTRLSTMRPLGSYRVRVQGGDTVALTLDTLEGSLLLQGTGRLLNGRVRFSGEASAAPESEAALSNLLNILGQRQGAKSILKMG